MLLGKTEHHVLLVLASRPNRVFSRRELLEAMYGPQHAVTGRAIDVQIVGLRKKLGEHGALIRTVRGVGYQLSVSFEPR